MTVNDLTGILEHHADDLGEAVLMLEDGSKMECIRGISVRYDDDGTKHFILHRFRASGRSDAEVAKPKK